MKFFKWRLKTCIAGFSGVTCEITPCTDDPCLNNGICEVSPDWRNFYLIFFIINLFLLKILLKTFYLKHEFLTLIFNANFQCQFLKAVSDTNFLTLEVFILSMPNFVRTPLYPTVL